MSVTVTTDFIAANAKGTVIQGPLAEILSTPVAPGCRAYPSDVTGTFLEMGSDGLWTGASVGTLTQAQADAVSAAQGVKATLKLGTVATVNGSQVTWRGAGSGGWGVTGSRIAKLKKLTNQIPVLPATIGTMPTLTTSAKGEGTQISGGVLVASTNAAIKYSADMKVAGGTYPDYTAIRGFSVNYGTGRQANLTRAAFYYDGTDIEIQIIGSGDTSFRLYVDGQIANEAASVTADGGFYRHKITFASAAKRLIEWEFNAFTKIVEFRRNPTATLWACPRNVRVIFLGDSVTEGPSGAFAQTSKAYAPLCGRMLGWDDTWISGVGSTGYVAAPGGKLPIKDRISTDVAPYNPDVVVVAMGINDSDALTEATVLETLTAIRAAIAPDAPIFVFGAWNPKSIPMATRNAKIKSAAEKVTLCFYVDDTFFTGTGRSGATVGDGNSDFYVFTDNTHPTQSGAEYLAIRCATGIAAICANL